MRFHEFGTDSPDILLVVQPRLVTWDVLLPDIRLLSERYHVVVPVLPGHDFQDGGDFWSVERTAKELEDGLIARGYLDILGALGIDIGGSVVVRLLADSRIRIMHAIIDEGVLPHQGSSIVSKLEAARDYLSYEAAKLSVPKGLGRLAEHISSEEERGIICGTLQRISTRSVWNLSASCHNYELPKGPIGGGSAIEYWYAEGSRKRRRQDIRTVEQAIPTAKIVKFPDAHPLEFALHHAREYSLRIQHALAQPVPAAC